MKLHYNTANANLNAAANYNGNISAIEWRVGANCQVSGVTRNKAAYGFTYDSQNRLTKSVYGEYNSSNTWQSTSLNRYTVDPIAYDDNGNITAITRKGWISGTTWNTIDQLTYSYSATHGNQLTAIAEASDLTRGFKKVSAGASGYVYDNNGNLTADGYRGITGITYNYLNLPAKITYSATKYIELTYDAAGRKWKKTAVDGATVTEKYYLGSLEYNGSNLEAIYHEEGRVIPIGAAFDYQYSIRDHLGNSRVMFKLVGSTATLIQESHFYPFGMEQDGNFVSGSDPHLYNGKELNEDFGLGWYDYGARWYMPDVGRWNTIDPLADFTPNKTPYHFVSNNPINRSDPDGLTDYTFNKKTGAVTLVGVVNDEPDRILKTNRKGEINHNKKGEAKIAIDGIAKGILKDGQNFKNDDNIINVNGEGQPTLQEVENFVTKIGEYLGVEMSGAYLARSDELDADIPDSDIAKVYIDEYKGNKAKEASTTLSKIQLNDESVNGTYLHTHFHTHPSNIGISRSDIERPSGTTGTGGDLQYRNNTRPWYKRWIILTRTTTYPTKVQRIDYTDW